MNLSPFRVLLIDDDPQVGLVIKRVLGTTFDIVLAGDAEAALVRMRDDEPYPLVVCDLRMPVMNGFRLLEHIRSHWPDSILIILSGETQFELATEALNAGHVFRFLSKPCDVGTLRKAFLAAEAQWTARREERDQLERAWRGSVQALLNMLAFVAPSAFARANRVAATAGQLAAALSLPQAARVVMAARLTQLGTVALSAPLAKALEDGSRVGADHILELRRLPSIASRMLAEIPRSEEVRRILSEAGSITISRQLSSEASIVRIVLRLDAITNTQQKFDELLAELEAESPVHAGETLSTVRSIFSANYHQSNTRSILLPLLTEGMILSTDVRAPDGLLLAARGQRVTTCLLNFVQRSWGELAPQQTVEVESLGEAA